jgi:hypothetical protein
MSYAEQEFHYQHSTTSDDTDFHAIVQVQDITHSRYGVNARRTVVLLAVAMINCRLAISTELWLTVIVMYGATHIPYLATYLELYCCTVASMVVSATFFFCFRVALDSLAVAQALKLLWFRDVWFN